MFGDADTRAAARLALEAEDAKSARMWLKIGAGVLGVYFLWYYTNPNPPRTIAEDQRERDLAARALRDP